MRSFEVKLTKTKSMILFNKQRFLTQANQDAVPSDQSLVCSLHCLLRKRHHQVHALPTPRPVTAYPLQGGAKRLCLAGASALTAAEVASDLQRCVGQTLLNQMICMICSSDKS